MLLSGVPLLRFLTFADALDGRVTAKASSADGEPAGYEFREKVVLRKSFADVPARAILGSATATARTLDHDGFRAALLRGTELGVSIGDETEHHEGQQRYRQPSERDHDPNQHRLPLRVALLGPSCNLFFLKNTLVS